MAFTRFHDDTSRILKTNIETASMCNYTFNVPRYQYQECLH